jgi:1,4-dihydroxy-2-naphthoate octaprenyltransferase
MDALTWTVVAIVVLSKLAFLALMVHAIWSGWFYTYAPDDGGTRGDC